VLVLSYTLGGMVAPALGAAALQASPHIGFPLVLSAIACIGGWVLTRSSART